MGTADDAPLLLPCPDRAVGERADAVRRLSRVINDRVVHPASAEHDAPASSLCPVRPVAAENLPGKVTAVAVTGALQAGAHPYR